MDKVTLLEVSPRDGIQNEDRILTVDQRIELINRAVDAGARRVEAVSFVNPRRVPQMAHAEDVMAGLNRDRGVSYSGLALNVKGAERLVAAGCDELTFVVVATETFSQRNQGRSVYESVAEWQVAADLARGAGLRTSVIIAAAFGCPFEGTVSAETVATLAERLAEGQPDEVALADTIGVGVPAQVHDLAARVGTALPEAALRCHLHNTRNTGYANAIAALDAGIRVLDASIGGVGGCPFAPNATGNVATEDLVYMLHASGYDTGLDFDGLK